MGDSIQKPSGQKGSIKQDTEIELNPLKKVTKTATSKVTQHGKDISHVKDSADLQQEEPIDGYHPKITKPMYMNKAEVFEVAETLESKIAQPATVDQIITALSESSDALKNRIKTFKKEVNDTLQSGISIDRQLAQLQMSIMKLTDVSMDISGEYAKSISAQQATEKKNQFEIMQKQKDLAAKEATTGLIMKIFGWIGDVVNVLFACAAVVATGLTAGLLTAGAVAWAVGAFMGLAARALAERPDALKDTKFEWLGSALTYTGIALSLAGVGLSAAASAARAGEAIAQTLIKVTAEETTGLIPKFQQVTSALKVVGEGTTKITGTIFHTQSEYLRADSVASDKVQQELMSHFTNALSFLQDLLTNKKDLAERVSANAQRAKSTISAVLGNI